LAHDDADRRYETFSYLVAHDDVIGDQNASLPGRTVLWVPNHTWAPAHFAAMFDTRILADIARRLRQSDKPRISG
jgi:hypothetical protein